MYNKFFGFKEKPFKLVPDPEYLFLSKSHEEALAHLGYAIAHGDGFVEITGEVGTGKTTLCRVFLENLDESIEPAYIFNPKLDALQLLKAINDEFGIDSTPDNTKDLIDRLNVFLIEKKGAGKKVLVLIDEAQNLSLEVLEQLRLLSNLETTREKLLQIVLVGQPELGDMLSSHRLRQLGQRITINFQLQPLTFDETRDYIRHRISLASHRAGPPFDKGAYRAIYEFSQGIPRLINIACDRALLNAYSRSSFSITAPIAKEAFRELHRTKNAGPAWRQQMPVYLGLAVVAISLLGIFLYFNSGGNQGNSASSKGYSPPEASGITRSILVPAVQTPVAADKASSLQTRHAGNEQNQAGVRLNQSRSPGTETRQTDSSEDPALKTVPSYASAVSARLETGQGTGAGVPAEISTDMKADRFLLFLKGLNSRHSRNSAMDQALKRWNPAAVTDNQIQTIDSDQAFFREAAAQNGLQVQPVATEADLTLIQTLNLPAVLTFYLPYHTWPKYMTLTGLDSDNAYLDAGDQGGITIVDRKSLLRFWSGEAYIVWNNFAGLEGIITEHSSPGGVQALKELLVDLAYIDNVGRSRYDAGLKQLIRDIQTKNGLDADGMVGPLTKIVLYNADDALMKPSLDNYAGPETDPGPEGAASAKK